MKKDLEEKIHQFALQMHLDGYINGFEKGYKQGLDDTTKIGEWISVGERLPDEVGTYMTTVDYEKHGIAVGQRYYHGKGLGWEDDCVIAWMPLPKPYRPQEREDKE